MRLSVEHVYKNFTTPGHARLPVLHDIDFVIEPGKLIAIIGPSGCGKSTLLEIIAGLQAPTHGEVRLSGYEGKLLGQSAYMTQEPALLPWQTIVENLLLPACIASRDLSAARTQALQLLERFGLLQFAHAYPAELSGGMRQRAALAQAYMSQKELLLLDEPFVRLDALTRLEMHQWLATQWEHQAQVRLALLVTHDIDEAIFLADRIVVLSPRPARVLATMPVNTPRPRRLAADGSAVFAKIKKEILSLLAFPMAQDT